MKIIFSRVPSPLINNHPRSLPIPTRMPTSTHYSDIAAGISDIVNDLTTGRIASDHPCHLDPDLDPNSLARLNDQAQIACAMQPPCTREACASHFELPTGKARR